MIARIDHVEFGHSLADGSTQSFLDPGDGFGLPRARSSAMTTQHRSDVDTGDSRAF